MKKNSLIPTLMVTILFACSCINKNDKEQSVSIGFTKGAKISSSGLKTVHNGLTFEESYFIADGTKTESNEVKIGQKVAIVFDGIGGLKEKNGKVFPQLNILVLDAKNQIVVAYDDLLKSDTGYDVIDATMLTGSLTIGDPLKKGESYTLTVTIGDKDTDSSIVGNITLKVK